MSPRRTLAAVALSALAAAALPPAAVAAEEAAAVRGLLGRYGPATVSVEAVVKMEMQMNGQGNQQEGKLDLVGAVVDPGGLIMVWNSSISSSRFKEMVELMGRGGDDFDVKLTPTSFEVTLPGAARPQAAFLAASDSNLDVAFLQLAEPPAEPLVAVDFAAAASPAVGQTVYAVSRLNPSFDRTLYLSRLLLVGEMAKPRRGWVVDGEPTTLGLPVFDDAGRPVGVLASVLSSVGTDPGGGMQGFGGMLGGQNGKTSGPIGVFVLPPEPVARAIALSKERAAKLLAERAEAAPAPGP